MTIKDQEPVKLTPEELDAVDAVAPCEPGMTMTAETAHRSANRKEVYANPTDLFCGFYMSSNETD